MTKPLNVTIVILGYADSLFDLDLLKKHRSNIFHVCDIHTKRILPSPNQSYGTLNIEYSFQDIDNMLKDVKGDFVVGIIDYPMQNGFFGHQTEDKKFCLSIRKPRFILEKSNICIENFILKSIYKFILHAMSNQRSHRDTRRCIFDLNGDLQDIVFNTEKVTICSECKSKLEKKIFLKVILNFLKKNFYALIKTL